MKILEWARKVQAIAQCGLTFAVDPYDRERYEQLQELVSEVLSTELELPVSETKAFWDHETGYATPKVDVRGAVFSEGKILLVRERSDGKWTLPGGWADVNDTPSVAIEREIVEESGFRARAVKLAAVFDRDRQGHPPAPFHAYKLFFLCELLGGEATPNLEIEEVRFFALDELPELSAPRITRHEIERLFVHEAQRDLPTEFD